jgi:hypothetical protein
LRIGFALIDVAASILLAIALTGIVLEGANAGQNDRIRGYADKEELRQEVYALFYSGAMARIAEMGADEFPLDLGNVTICRGEGGGGCACLFLHVDGGITTFSVSRKG